MAKAEPGESPERIAAVSAFGFEAINADVVVWAVRRSELELGRVTSERDNRRPGRSVDIFRASRRGLSRMGRAIRRARESSVARDPQRIDDQLLERLAP
ncbi:MAG: hypothetical protein ABI467_02080 [Kofleriaceae bacterium]